MMYRSILVAVDNSRYSLWGADHAIELAKSFDAALVGNHVYAARLHEERFIQMEPGLPAKYQSPGELKKQREIHGDLIGKGLRIISNSYIDALKARCEEAGVPCEQKTMEGKNYHELVNDIARSSYDLVTIGARGLGEVDEGRLGSVCERVVRRINVDTLVIKNGVPIKGGHVVVGVDGSEQSFAAVWAAISMSKRLGCRVTALSVFDPFFHYKAFGSIAETLSEEDGKAFRFEEQEKLHKEIIDSGLERIYREHLNTAARMAAREDAQIETELLAGKPHQAISGWLEGKQIALLLLGKVGVHSNDELDIGSNSENLLRDAQCNVMLVSRKIRPGQDAGSGSHEDIGWEPEAVELLNKVPGFVRNMVRGHMEALARRENVMIVTAGMMKEARLKMGM
jgi:nucleotide-binding universal stress UspA family protein